MEATIENVLNVTLLEPRLKHPTIFRMFDELQGGENLIIHNDHDPKPVYYQLLGERGNIFKWEYLEQGPQWWKVRITKNGSDEKDETIGQIAASDIRKAEIFKKYGLDFCCGGKKTVKEACASKGLDVTKIEQELQQADKNVSTRPMPYNDWSLDFLVDYIINTHHAYIRKTLPEIRGYAAKVLKVHGAQHPELKHIQPLVENINDELIPHMTKEEKILFPYIKQIVQAKNENRSLQTSGFNSVQTPINVMEMEHDIVAEDLEEIKTLSNNYTIPQDACASYNLLYKMLSEFEDDLHTHIHLENNILFPKVIELEKQLLS
jgi:regulator of cell morphogenesis and NO signaling